VSNTTAVLVGISLENIIQQISNSKVGMMMEQGEAKERQTVAKIYNGILPIKDANEFFRFRTNEIEGTRDPDFWVSSLH
jgi:hypothetical protein